MSLLDKIAYENNLAFAQRTDNNSPLQKYRNHFHFPQHAGRDVLYFCGNSLGLQPIGVEKALLKELAHWRTHGVEGHFKGDKPWVDYHAFLAAPLAQLVGAKKHEVVVMNTLTTNLHLMMVSFYQPTSQRFKIIMEAGAFPSDQYAVESQVQFHGFQPEKAIVEVPPRPGEETIRTEDIIKTIEEEGESVALVMWGGVNYYTGQCFDMEAIVAAGHKVGAYVGFDLAHAAGNVPLALHNWKADFAVWCSYKYLNAGPGGPGAAFVHERHGKGENLPMFAGWWGHNRQERFLMRKGFQPMGGADSWQLSNAQVLSFAAYMASLEVFEEVGFAALRQKSIQLTGYLAYLIKELNATNHPYRIITPQAVEARGCQLSIITPGGRELYDYLAQNGVVCDWREPDVVRLAPVPLYNSFEDVYTFSALLQAYKS